MKTVTVVAALVACASTSVACATADDLPSPSGAREAPEAAPAPPHVGCAPLEVVAFEALPTFEQAPPTALVPIVALDADVEPARPAWGATVRVRWRGAAPALRGARVGALDVPLPRGAATEGFVVPLGASGPIVLRTDEGEGTVGVVSPAWPARAVATLEGAEPVTVIGGELGLGADDSTAVLRSDARVGAAEGARASVLAIVRLGPARARVARLAGVARASRTVVGAARGAFADVIVAESPEGFVHLTVRSEFVEVRRACLPAGVRALGVQRTRDGEPVGWVGLPTTDPDVLDVARLRVADDHLALERADGRVGREATGVHRLDDGTWLEGSVRSAGHLFDDKEAIAVSRTSPVGARVGVHDSAGLDDWLEWDVLPSSGAARPWVVYCNQDVPNALGQESGSSACWWLEPTARAPRAAPLRFGVWARLTDDGAAAFVDGRVERVDRAGSPRPPVDVAAGEVRGRLVGHGAAVASVLALPTASGTRLVLAAPDGW